MAPSEPDLALAPPLRPSALVVALLVSIACGACASHRGPESTLREAIGIAAPEARSTLVPFESDAAWRAYLGRVAVAASRARRYAELHDLAGAGQHEHVDPPWMRSALVPSESRGRDGRTTTVDEGGSVKRRGDHLLILRRNRLSSVRIGGGRLERIDTALVGPTDRFPAERAEQIIVHEDTAWIVSRRDDGAVILTRLPIDAEGRFGRPTRGTLALGPQAWTGDLTVRRIGDSLAFYASFDLFQGDPSSVRAAPLPTLQVAGTGSRRAVLHAGDIRRPIQIVVDPRVHALFVCDLAAPSMSCTGRGVIARRGAVAASRDAVYVATSDDALPGTSEASTSVVFRFSFDGGEPTAARIPASRVGGGNPVLRASEDEVLVSVEARGGARASAASRSATARLGRSAFARNVPRLPRSALGPAISGTEDVAERLASGANFAIDGPGSARDEVLRLSDSLVAAWRPDRENGITIDFVALRPQPRVLESLVVRAGPRETLPLRKPMLFHPGHGESGWLVLTFVDSAILGGPDAATVELFRVEPGASGSLGALSGASRSGRGDDGGLDDCWFCDARPFFVDERIFATLGDELVEGRYVEGRDVGEQYVDGRLVEAARVPLVPDASTPHR